MLEPQISIEKGRREKLAELLNLRLADAIDLWLQAKQAHWNVKGDSFYALHKLFDEVAGQAEQFVDELAERCVALGGLADGKIDTVHSRSTLPPYPKSVPGPSDHCRALSMALAAFGANTRSGIDLADEWRDKATADLFTEITRAMDKLLWMVEAHLAGRH